MRRKETKKGPTTLLGEDLRRRRGHRSLMEIQKISESPPYSYHVKPIAFNTLSNLEKGKSLPTIETLQTLSMVFNVPEMHFLNLIKLDKYWKLRPETEDYIQAKEIGSKAHFGGDYAKAYASFYLCEKLAPSLEELALSRNNKSIALWKLGLLDEAISQLAGINAIPDLPLHVRTKVLLNLSEVYRSKGNLFMAKLISQEGLKLAEQDEHLEHQAHLLRTLGNVKSDIYEKSSEKKEQEIRDSIKLYERSSKLFEAIGDNERVALNVTNIGLSYILIENFLLGFKYLEEGLEKCEKTDNKWNIAFTLKELGKAYFLAKDFQRSKDKFWESERISNRLNYVDLLFIDYFYLMEIDIVTGGDGEYNFKKCLSLKGLQEGTFLEMEKFEKYIEERTRKERLG